MFLSSKQSQRTGLMLIDLVAVVIAFFAAVYTRFYNESDWKGINSWNGGLYYLLLELVIAINLVVFLLNESRHRPIDLQNPLEKLINVIKNNVLQSAFLIMLLYLIKQGLWASRAVVLALFVYNVFLDFIFRFFYGRYVYRLNVKNTKTRRFILLTSADKGKAELRKFRAGMGRYAKLSSVMFMDRNDDIKEIDGVKVLGNLENLQDINNSKQFDEIICFADDNKDLERVLKYFDDSGIQLNIIPELSGNAINSDVFENVGYFDTLTLSFMSEKSRILGVNFTVSNIWDAVLYIQRNIKKLYGKYICFSNVHTTVMAYEDEEYRKVQNEAEIVFPDGAPISKLQKRRGYKRAGRVAGPDFMQKMFLSSIENGISMYFYGSSPETIEALKKNIEKNYPGLDVRGYESPPFRRLTEEEDNEAVKRINDSGADIVWIGLGAPKQERWMYEHKGRINALMLGVGAGFDFHAGTIRRAPEWMQHVGLEWLFRLFQDPKRLIKRYFVTNLKFMYYLTLKK